MELTFFLRLVLKGTKVEVKDTTSSPFLRGSFIEVLLHSGMKSCDHINFFLDVDEVVKPILFLLSEQSAMVNCATLSIDGGFAAC